MSGMIHKVKEAITGHPTNSNTSTNHGPHDSNVANKLDPRVDSDRDHRAAHHAGTNGAQQDPFGAAGGVNAPYNTAGSRFTNTGPHDSNVANKIDPRVDSDDNRVRRQALGGAHGPYSSNMANKLDPLVDSNRDNRAAGIGATGTMGTGAYTSSGTHGYGTGTMGTGTGTTHSTAGLHSSNLANKLDPRVDSDLDNRRNVHTQYGL
ncbi:hypothetical protein BDV28DRAFT_131067 [Aspergillus coremiiformis]|uniref:Cell surface protein n=1 Tax=Aspergillus coremiiformis TaxID=138285 RepID=A0A5N6ZAF7_9EURO|nr:hypothetical protein BDV28DRAFT_131067 [Aspergillus coremiiformis]